MNIPSPAIVKKQIDQRKAFESYEKDTSSVSASASTVSDTSNRSKKSPEISANQGRGHQNSNPSKTSSSQTPKKAFVPPEHLTTKPLREHQGLEALKKSLGGSEKRRRGTVKAASTRRPRTTSTIDRSTKQSAKKENN